MSPVYMHPRAPHPQTKPTMPHSLQQFAPSCSILIIIRCPIQRVPVLIKAPAIRSPSTRGGKQWLMQTATTLCLSAFVNLPREHGHASPSLPSKTKGRNAKHRNKSHPQKLPKPTEKPLAGHLQTPPSNQTRVAKGTPPTTISPRDFRMAKWLTSYFQMAKWLTLDFQTAQ